MARQRSAKPFTAVRIRSKPQKRPVNQAFIVFSTMKHSQLAGICAVVAMAVICFIPWAYLPERNLTVSGMETGNTMFGKPGLMHLILGAAMVVFFLLKKIWAKRANVFVAAANIAWSFRNYTLFTTCFMGECPHIKAGIYMLIIACFLIQIMTFLPKIDVDERG